MLSFFKKIISNNYFRLSILILIVLAVINYSHSRFLFVKAYNSQINIFPGEFSIEQDEDKIMSWQKIENVFMQEVAKDAKFSEYNENNSAFISSLPKDNETEAGETGNSGGEEGTKGTGDSEDEIENPSYFGEDKHMEKGEKGGILGEEELFEEFAEIKNHPDERKDSEEGPEENTQNNDDKDGFSPESGVQDDSGVKGGDELSQDNDSGMEKKNSGQEKYGEELENYEKGEEKADKDSDSDAGYINNEKEDKIIEGPSFEEQSEAGEEAEEAVNNDEKSEMDIPEKEFKNEDTQESSGEEANSGQDLSFFQKALAAAGNIQGSFKKAFAKRKASAEEEELPDKDDEEGGDKAEFLKQSLIFSDFSVPLDFPEDKLRQLSLKINVAGKSSIDEDYLLVEYSLGGGWKKLGDAQISEIMEIKGPEAFSLLFNEPVSWHEIKDLDIKISYVDEEYSEINRVSSSVFIDSIFLVAEYFAEEVIQNEIEEEVVEEESDNNDEYDLELISGKKTYKIGEKPVFNFIFRKKRDIISSIGAGIASLFYDEFNELSVQAKLKDHRNEYLREDDYGYQVEYLKNGKFEVNFTSLPRQFKPGKHILEISLSDPQIDRGKTFVFQEEFSWGVLAFNLNKSIYLPGDTAYMQVGVLNEKGHTLCDARLEITIETPDGRTFIMSTLNGQITTHPYCAPDSITDRPDYYAYFKPEALGKYNVILEAITSNGAKVIKDSFEMRNEAPFDIERVGPTRIYPWAPYQMLFKVWPHEDYEGLFKEYIPSSFDLLNDYAYKIRRNKTTKELSWNVNWKKGEYYELKYLFDAPDISPEFYLLGPARTSRFAELRQWQIASDADIDHVVAERIGIDGGTIDTSNWTESVKATSTLFTGGDKYFIYVASGLTNSSAAGTIDYEIVYGSNTQYTGLIDPTASDVYDAQQIAWFDVYDQPATPVDIVLNYRPNAGQAHSFNAQIVAINLSELDSSEWAYNHNTTSQEHPNGSWDSMASITLSSADGHDDWLVMGMEELDIGSNSRSFYNRLYDGSTAYMSYDREGENTAELLTYVLMRPFDAVAQNTVFSWQISEEHQNADAQHLESRIFALNLTAFESYKTYYADTNTAINTTWTEMGSLNTGGNFTPTTTGDHFIFASFINDAGSSAAATDDRLQVSGSTVPSSWSWTQGVSVSRTTYETSDELSHNIFAKTSIPDTGYTIDLDALEVVSGSQVGDEVSMTVFSARLDGVTSDPPTGSFNSLATRTDGSGVVDISIEVDDPNDDDVRALIEYEAGDTCAFATQGDPTLDETDANTTADFGDPNVENDNLYQIGNSSGWIKTASGSNTVLFDWLSQSGLSTADGVYCLRLTVDDTTVSQTVPDTATATLDNVAPTAPGNLSVYATSGTSVVLMFGASTTETNFSNYKIYYKAGASDPTESDSSHSDASMSYQDYNSATSTTVTGLMPDTQYVFNIWAYDDYGNKASATTEVLATTSSALVPPISSINSMVQRSDGAGVVDISLEVDDGNDDDVAVKMEYEAGNNCTFAMPLDPILDETDGNTTADDGDPKIENDNAYQIGNASGWIETGAGSNSVFFDWPTQDHDPDLDGEYCVQFTAWDSVSGNQTTSATTTITIDNTAPTSPGPPTIEVTTDTSIKLGLGSTSTEENFSEYKIFYSTSSPATESDYVQASSTDANLGNILYNSATTTTITGLIPETQYWFVIYVYDQYGNKASSSQASATTDEAVSRRANTVMFQAGVYSGDSTTGKNSDTNHTFSAFNFKLAESGVEIKSAYIIFESQFEAYSDNAGDYSGYNLAFDACRESCSADAFSGSGRVLKDDNTDLAYDEDETNQARLLLDVSDEDQISAYSGGGASLEGQAGYRIERGSAVNSIANAKATLVITYSYEVDATDDITNTVVYPLDSDASGDQGSRRSSQANSCTLDNDCPTFSYNMEVPEVSEKLSQWFQTYAAMDRNSGVGQSYDYINVDVNIEGQDVNSSNFLHKATDGSTWSHMPIQIFDSVYGFQENNADSLEYRAVCAVDTLYYLIGGEVFETYTASTSASAKTRTVSFPIGVINNGLTTSETSTSVDIYFPENGAGSGVVDIKSAWLKLVSSNHTGAGTITISTQAGDNAESNDFIYSYDTDSVVAKPAFNIIHIVPESDYSEMESANAESSKTISVYTTNSTANQGGISAELMITYIYTDESNGYLSTLNLFGGQSDLSGNAQTASPTAAVSLAPEYYGTKNMYAGALLAHFLMSDSDGDVPSAAWTFDANLSTSINPACANTYNSRPLDSNGFTEFYKDISSALSTTDSQAYYVCYSNSGGGDTSAGAKMGGSLIYTYGWEAPPSEYEQNDWRWYDNTDAIQPTNPKAAENTSISNVNIGDILRLRLNLGVSSVDLSTTSQNFKIQYGWGADCTALSNWTDVGATSSSESWRFYNNNSVADGAEINSTLLASSTVKETYEESNSSALNPNAISTGNYGEWDFPLYNLSATSSAKYCFRMIKSDDEVLDVYNSDSYPIINTAPGNTAPNNPASLDQYLDDEATVINNGAWINENSVKLVSRATDPNISETITLYYEFIPATSTFTVSTNQPAGACAYGAAYNDCNSKIWFVAPGAPGDYRTDPYIGTTSITSIPQNYSGYKWQVIACDDDAACASWIAPDAPPNLKIDLTDPSPPGALSVSSVSATGVVLQFGASTTEDNFLEYKIFYKQAASGVTEGDLLLTDSDLDYQDYNNTSTTSIDSLAAGTIYTFNIWAYDEAGNKASSTEVSTTTGSSFTEPTGSIFSLSQRTDGSGAVYFVIRVDDADNDDTLRAKIEYEAGSSCVFASNTKAAIDTDPARLDATNLPAPDVDNSNDYQVGTTTGWILTSPGENFVEFDWLSKTDIPGVDGTYCARLTVNDGLYDQITPDTALIIIDNLAPTSPGALTLDSKTADSLTLNFGDSSFDLRFDEYRMFYSTSSPVTENDQEHIDANLGSENYENAATTTISGLKPGTLYYVNIWGYDTRGNKASSTVFSTTTNAYPDNLSAAGQYKEDGITLIANGNWITGSTTNLAAEANDPDSSEILTLYYELKIDSGTFTTATSVPVNACVSGTSYDDCTGKIWYVASVKGDYSSQAFTATATISDIPDLAEGYKWQVLACDDDGDCNADWSQYNADTPNFKVDTTAPTAPGNLSLNAKTSQTISLNFGATTTEDNFREYIIYYSTSTPVNESDDSHASSTDSNLGHIDYNDAALTTISGLSPNTLYYINIWAYDEAGNSASSTEISVTTSQVASTPGVLFYAKNDRTLYYRVWNGSSWDAEQSGPTLGSAAGDNIRHIRAVRSDNGTRVGVVAKTWDGTNQEWWGTVYLFAADTFATSTQLGTAYAATTNNDLITSCIASLSGGEFFVVRNNNGANGTLVYSWNSANGWTSEGAGPDPGGIVNGCRLARRPSTDNYLLVAFDDTNHGGQNNGDVGSAYYYGGSAYSDSWTAWTEHGYPEEDIDNYVGEAFFDPSDNTRGAINYSASNNTSDTKAKYFVVTNTTINYGVVDTAPATWAGDFVHGEFFPDTGGTGLAYYAGRDVNDELNIFKLDISGGSPVWATTTNGDNISGSGLYDETNNSQKPFAAGFYKDNYALALWNDAANTAPQYRLINALTNTVDAADTAVPDAGNNVYARVRTYEDPNENELLAVYQNDDVDYAAVFFDGNNNRFYNTTDNPASNQVWTELAVNAGPADENYECTAFSFAAGNSSPNIPTGLYQYKSGGSTEIANGSWTNEQTVNFKASATDPDTSEVITLYLELIASNENFTSTTSEPANACASTTLFTNCISKIWEIASSTEGDYSSSPYTARIDINSISESSIGYKWRIIACDDDASCSGWKAYNVSAPNFKVDITPPSAPGPLNPSAVTSQTVTLDFGATTTEDNFLEYRIYYSSSSPVALSDIEHDDSDLDDKFFNGASDTQILGLDPSTLYYFNIWAFDQAGNSATSSSETSTTTHDTYYLNQTSYLLENDDGDSVNSNTAEGLASTTLSGLYIGERLAIRIQMENTGGDIADNKVYKLQFENRTDSPGSWSDVGAATAISYAFGLSGDNGDIISSRKAEANGSNWVNGTWHEDTAQTGSFSLNNGEYTEFVFMVETSGATAGKTYRFRLYSQTDASALDEYGSYPFISIKSYDDKRISKGVYSSLPVNTVDLTYYLDPEGYFDAAADDNTSRDPLSSSSNIPVYNFVYKNNVDTDAISVSWNGSSSVASSLNNTVLQVYRFGTTDAWTTVSSNSGAASQTEFNLSGSLNSNLTDYYSAGNWSYWRVYQESGTQTLDTDYFSFSTSTPVADVSQIHYRWRDDDGSEILANWREAEDKGSPTASTSVAQGENIRLRISAVNLGGGSALNYAYQIQYSTSTGVCESATGWTTIPDNSALHWKMSTSSSVANGEATTEQLDNSETYDFTAGSIAESPSSTSSPVTLAEGDYTEIEYVILATANSVAGGTYCFRVTNNGAPLDAYSEYPVLTLAGVTNTAPYFTVFPSDNGSATSSPTNEGTNVDFTATAQDDEDDDYYLAVCQTPGISAGNDSPPVCSGGSWCVSSLASSTAQAVCSYTAATSTESASWYAYACDKHPGFAVGKCSLLSQGNSGAANDSPFVVNHYPVLTSVSTVENNKDPGGYFKISTVSYDNDSVDGADTLTLFVCATDEATEIGCASTTVCQAVATSSPNASCYFNDTAPTPAGDYTYYAFIYDNHNLAASGNSRNSFYTVNNVSPVLGTLLLNGGDSITLNLRGAGDTSVSTVNASVVDQNGCDSGLVSAVATIYMSNVSGGYNCVADDNVCYKAAVGDCAKSECGSDNDSTATYTCTVNMKYFASPTDISSGNPLQPYKWESYINVYDGANYAATTSAGVELETSFALDVQEAAIDFGAGWSVNQNSGSDNSTTTVYNIGNSPIDADVSGTDMVGNPSGTIEVSNIEWSLNNFSWGGGTQLKVFADADKAEITAPKATSSNDVADEIYWGIGIPFTADASTYNGQNTFTVRIDPDDWD